MKKILSLFILAALLLSLVACGGTETDSPTTELSTEEITTEEVTTEEVTTEEITTEEVTTEEITTEEITTEEITTEPEEEKFVYKHVIIVGVDGMGAYRKGVETPNIDSIFADYAITDIAQTYNPVATGPCWLSMMTGVDPRVMRVTTNPDDSVKINKYLKAHEKYPSLFELVHDKYSDSASIVSVATGWTPLNEYVWPDLDYIQKEGKPIHWTFEEEKQNILSYINKMDTSKNNFAYFYLHDCDSKGHNYGWGTDEFNAAVARCDAAVGEIFNSIKNKGMLEDTLFILATDHGGEGTKHGHIYTPAALDITLGFRGKTINNMKDFPMILRDVAPIIVDAMALEPSSAWKNLATPPVIPEGLFKD